MRYKISEIFYSIQSEGKYSGTPATFIRFYGCNLDCPFCDEPLHKIVKTEYSIEDILNAINSDCKHIVITGGEPTLNNLSNLIIEFKRNGHFIQIESNGYNLENVKDADYITVSPKDYIRIDDKINEYKFISRSNIDIKEVIELSKTKQVYLQPMADGDTINNENTLKCIEIIKQNPTLKLSLQLHKYTRIQ